jgi:hypothetical protein
VGEQRGKIEAVGAQAWRERTETANSIVIGHKLPCLLDLETGRACPLDQDHSHVLAPVAKFRSASTTC